MDASPALVRGKVRIVDHLFFLYLFEETRLAGISRKPSSAATSISSAVFISIGTSMFRGCGPERGGRGSLLNLSAFSHHLRRR